jgi:cytochrome bd-type quinol oxidase subunit 1
MKKQNIYFVLGIVTGWALGHFLTANWDNVKKFIGSIF